jgi:hypothetical protein
LKSKKKKADCSRNNITIANDIGSFAAMLRNGITNVLTMARKSERGRLLIRK